MDNREESEVIRMRSRVVSRSVVRGLPDLEIWRVDAFVSRLLLVVFLIFPSRLASNTFHIRHSHLPSNNPVTEQQLQWSPLLWESAFAVRQAQSSQRSILHAKLPSTRQTLNRRTRIHLLYIMIPTKMSRKMNDLQRGNVLQDRLCRRNMARRSRALSLLLSKSPSQQSHQPRRRPADIAMRLRRRCKSHHATGLYLARRGLLTQQHMERRSTTRRVGFSRAVRTQESSSDGTRNDRSSPRLSRTRSRLSLLVACTSQVLRERAKARFWTK